MHVVPHPPMLTQILCSEHTKCLVTRVVKCFHCSLYSSTRSWSMWRDLIPLQKVVSTYLTHLPDLASTRAGRHVRGIFQHNFDPQRRAVDYSRLDRFARHACASERTFAKWFDGGPVAGKHNCTLCALLATSGTHGDSSHGDSSQVTCEESQAKSWM